MDASNHGTEDQIERYTLGTLPEAELSAFEEHLFICEPCRERTEQAVAFTLAMREALPEALKEDAAQNLPAPAAPPSAPAGKGRAEKISLDWMGWLRKPAVSMAFGFALLLAAMAMYSNQRAGLQPVATLQLTATRGELPSVNRARELDLTLAGAPADGGPYRVEVVNAQGQNVWGSLADSEGDTVLVKVQARLQAGDYFVRLYSADGPILHEYGFRLKD